MTFSGSINKSLIISIAVILFISSCSNHKPAPVRDANNRAISSKPLSVQNKYNPAFVVVDKGDTLYSLGFKHQIDFKKLAEINKISSPYRIYPGQKLFLKETKSSRTNQNVAVTKFKKNRQLSAKQIDTKPTPVKKAVTEKTPNAKPINQVTKKPVNTNNPKPIVKPVQKMVSKTPLVDKKPTQVVKKPVSKPAPKPAPKPTPKPIAQAPSSNAKWIWPAHGKVVKTFSSKQASRKGINISTPTSSPVYATNNGTIVYSGNGLLGYGELIIVKHSDTLLSAYAHNSKRLVTEGDVVKQGQEIAKSGTDSEGKALLHFEIRKKGQPVNPMLYLPKR